jgi:hypothetical protein
VIIRRLPLADAVIVMLFSMLPLALALAATEGLICDSWTDLNVVSIGLQLRREKRKPLLRKGEAIGREAIGCKRWCSALWRAREATMDRRLGLHSAKLRATHRAA